MSQKEILIRRGIQIVTGALFLFSGVLKSFDSQSFSVLIANYGLTWAGNISPVISGIEIVLGLCLVLNISPKLTALLVGLLTVLFTLAFAFAFYTKGIEDCGCMGSFTFVKVPPVVSFIRNFLVIIGCFWIWRNSNKDAIAVPSWKRWIVYVIGGLFFCLSGYTVCNPLVPKNKINVGDQVNTGLFRYYASQISKGRSVIFIFSPDCGHCWNSTENVKSIKRIPELSNLIGVTFPGSDVSTYVKEMEPNFEIYNYPTDELSEAIGEAPMLLVLNNGRIERKIGFKDIPCGKMLWHSLGEE